MNKDPFGPRKFIIMNQGNIGLIKLDLNNLNYREQQFALLDFSSFLYDFELLYDFFVLSNLDDYKERVYVPSLWKGIYGGRFWTRDGRPIKDKHRLDVMAIDIHSPGNVVLGVGAKVFAETILPIIEAVGKIADWKFDRAKTRFEAERAKNEALKVGFEVERAKNEALKAGFDANNALIETETTKLKYQREKIKLSVAELEYLKNNTKNKILKRIEKNPIKVIGISIQHSIDVDHIGLELETNTIYQRLKRIARLRAITNYSDVGVLLGLDMSTEYGRVRISQILDDINKYEDKHGRPMLSSVVILKDGNMPGSGFFVCARELGKYKGNNDLAFWASEVKKVYDEWSKII